MNILELIDDLYEKAGEVISDMDQIKPEECGLDNRAGYRLYISPDAIAVSKSGDRSLQYYGGFEYVDDEYRQPLGEYVFYLREDDGDGRVGGHIDRWMEENEG